MDVRTAIRELVKDPAARQIVIDEVIIPLEAKGIKLEVVEEEGAAVAVKADDPKVPTLFDVEGTELVVADKTTFASGVPEAVDKRKRLWTPGQK